MSYYDDSISKALTSVYPDHAWELWRFSKVSKGYWDNKQHQREFFDSLVAKFQIKTHTDWYKITSSKVDEPMLPMARWKKHGLTDPSTSTTAETQGALQIGDSGEACPRCSWKRRGMRLSFSSVSTINLCRISSACSTISRSISSSSSATSLTLNAISLCLSPGHTRGRLKASEVRSAARKEMESKPNVLAAAAVARRWW